MNISLKAKLNVMAIAAIVSVILLVTTGFLIIAKSSIGSDLYEEIKSSSDFTAEIAPPPLFLVELNMHVNQLGIEGAGSDTLAQIKKHTDDYRTSATKWKANPHLSSDLKSLLNSKILPQMEVYTSFVEAEVVPAFKAKDHFRLAASLVDVNKMFDEHERLIDQLLTMEIDEHKKLSEKGESVASFYRTVLILVALLSVVAVTFFSIYFSRLILASLGADPEKLKSITRSITSGEANVVIEDAVPGSVLGSIADMYHVIASGQKAAVDNLRIRQALDATSSNVMLADLNRNIVYMNKAVEKMLRDVEGDLRKVLPHFKVDSIIGSNMDIFHKNPSHQSSLLANLRDTYVSNIVVAGISFRLIANPIFSDNGERIGSVVEWINRTNEVAVEHQMSRILGALNSTSSNVMVADPDRQIIYMNKSVEKMLRAVEVDLRKALPGFSVDKVIGSNIDIFHRNPSHQMQLLANLRDTYTSQITVAGITFRLIVNPIFSEAGERLGTVVEWIDRTKEVVAEHQMSRILGALNSTSSNVMVADPDRKIIYMNKSVEKMLRAVEMDLRKALPSFAVDKVIGSNIDIFHRNPAHQMQLLANLRDTYTSQITVAGITFRLIVNPIFSEAGERLGTVVEWIDRTKEVAAEHELSRILGALETATTNVMIADVDRKIIYMNKSVEKMLRVAEADLKSALPHFSVDKVVGSNMDGFHKNPMHQMKLLENLTTTYTTNIVVGKRHFRLVANPIFSKDGTRLGSVVEWLDRTEEVGVEGEVNKLVEAAASGNFTERLTTDGKSGFFLKLAEGLNILVHTADKGLSDVARVLGAIAKGDLTERITGEYAGTFGDLKNYCNETTENLTTMLSDIRSAADMIFTASSEIAQGNADLSSRTEQQAANLEETASSMEELTSTVKLNADNAKQANVLAEQASTVAIDGGGLIQQVVTTMNAINESARKISDIIGVIDGIAFQTNILALNAAVEAARAGDQGRGFAVVASEVRTLAQRSANAAKDIKALISDSVQKIDNGNSLVGKSGETMKEIVSAIKRVNDIMAEIAAASAEQSTGIEEISTAVSQMDEMTQQNAALVEQAAAAAESLQSQADELNRNVGQFRLSDSQERTPSTRLAAPKPANKPAAKSSGRNPAKATSTKSAGKLTPPASSAEDEWEQF